MLLITMLDFHLSKVSCKCEGRSDGDEGHGESGQEGQMGDDQTEEERDDEGLVHKDRGCNGTVRRPSCV